MLLRISLIVAILAGVGAGTLAYMEVSKQIPVLVQQRDDEKSAKQTAQTQLANTNKVLVKTRADLVATKDELAQTKTDLAKAQASADAATRRADILTDKLAKATQERDDAQNQLAAYNSTGLTPEQVNKLNARLKDSQAEIAAITDEKIVLQRVRDRLKAQLDHILGPDVYVKLPPDLRGKIVTVDPKWEFVVLNIGELQGLREDGELLVSRDGKLIAKVIVRTLQKDRAIANLVPGWKLGDVTEGDVVSPAHPAS